MSLRHAAFSAGRWTTASVLLRTLLQLAQTMILARLLAPSDFGLMAIVLAVHAIVVLFVDLGITSALIHFPTLTPRARSTLYWLNVGTAATVMLGLMALAWPIARIYGNPELCWPIMLMATALLLGALGQQFCVLAEKELHFSRLAVIELAAAASGFLAALGLAAVGAGVYALVGGAIVVPAVTSALAWALLSEGLRPAFAFDLRSVAAPLRHGMFRLGETLANAVHSQADVLIGGAVAGTSAMGVYTLPRNLALQLANSVVNPVVTRVGLPVMAKLQADPAALGAVYLQTLRMTASVNFPVYAVLAVWADEVVTLVLGSQWREAGDFLRMFALWGLVRSTGNPVGSLLYATGLVRRAFFWNLALLVLIPLPLLAAAMAGGTRGLLVAMPCLQLLMFYPLHRFLVQPASGITLRQYLGPLVPPFAAAALAAAAGYGVSLLPGLPPLIQLAIGGTCMAAIYLAVSRFVNPEWWAAMSELLRLRRPLP